MLTRLGMQMSAGVPATCYILPAKTSSAGWCRHLHFLRGLKWGILPRLLGLIGLTCQTCVTCVTCISSSNLSCAFLLASPVPPFVPHLHMVRRSLDGQATSPAAPAIILPDRCLPIGRASNLGSLSGSSLAQSRSESREQQISNPPGSRTFGSLLLRALAPP